MNLEQLQSMSDEELNELAAIKVMGWEISEYVSKNEVWAVIPQRKEEAENYFGTLWNPTNEVNDAMELWNKLHAEGWELSLSCDHKITTPWDCRMFLMEDHDVVKKVITHEKTAHKAITIASILAKGE